MVCPLTWIVLDKCHSDTDVTGLSPPYGDGIGIIMKKFFVVLFSPPYGDGISQEWGLFIRKMFSPPYGDGTSKCSLFCIGMWFSPPYGDCTLNISQNTAKLKSRMARKYSLYYNDVLLR